MGKFTYIISEVLGVFWAEFSNYISEVGRKFTSIISEVEGESSVIILVRPGVFLGPRVTIISEALTNLY